MRPYLTICGTSTLMPSRGSTLFPNRSLADPSDLSTVELSAEIVHEVHQLGSTILYPTCQPGRGSCHHGRRTPSGVQVYFQSDLENASRHEATSTQFGRSKRPATGQASCCRPSRSRCAGSEPERSRQMGCSLPVRNL